MGRSTRAGPSQSQKPAATQATQNGRKSNVNGKGKKAAAPTQQEEDEDEEMEAEMSDGEGGMDMDVDEVDENSDLARKANAVVRLALFTEQKRTYIRREDITKKALGTSSRAFNTIMELAQKKLRETFGMELYLLPSRAVVEGGEQKEGASNQTATGLKKKATATTSKNYILRSILDPVLIDRAAQTDEDILEEEAGDQAILFPAYLDVDLDNPNREGKGKGRRNGNAGDSDSDDDDLRQEAERAPKYYGSILSWTKNDQVGSLGILHVILALVLVHGRVIPDGKLRQYLKTLRLPSTPTLKPIEFKSTSTTRESNLDDFLSSFLKQGYLHRQLVGEDVAKKGKGKGGGGTKRVRAQADDMQAGQMYEWKWGIRSFAEVGEELVAKFIAEFMVSDYGIEDDAIEEEDEEEEEEEEEEEAPRRGKRGADKGKGKAKAKAKAKPVVMTAREKKEKKKEILKSMFSGVEKAAGGKLLDLQ